MKSAESDPSLALRYEWVEGSIPPPPYEWIIEIKDRQGRITFIPDYPQAGVVGWIKSFPVLAAPDKSAIRSMSFQPGLSRPLAGTS